MLASAQTGGFEIKARAIVPTTTLSTIHHLIHTPGDGIGDQKFATRPLFVHVFHCQRSALSHLLAQSHLPLLQRHFLRLRYIRDTFSRLLCFLCSVAGLLLLGC